MKEKEILKKLEILGIDSSDQLKKKELDFWWQKKYKEIKESQLKEETIKDKLIEINEIYEELSKEDKDLLVEIIIKQSKEENKVITDIDLYNLGVDLYNEKEYQKSIKKFSEAINLNSFDQDYFNLRGWAYYKLDKNDKAVEDATRAIDHKSDNPEYFRLRGWAYYHLKNYDKAIEDATRAIDLNPDEPDHFNLRGWAFWQIEEFEEAIQNFNIAIQIDKTKSDYFLGRYLAKLYSREIYKFRDLFNELNNALYSTKNNSSKSLVLHHRGKLYLKKDQYENALADFNESIELKEEIYCMEERLYTYIQLKEFSKAARDVLRCCDLDPDNMIYYKKKIIVHTYIDKLLETREFVLKRIQDAGLHPSWVDYIKNKEEKIINDKELTFSHLDEYNKAIKMVFKNDQEFFKILKKT